MQLAELSVHISFIAIRFPLANKAFHCCKSNTTSKRAICLIRALASTSV